MTVRERYWETGSGQFQKDVTYSGGLDAEGNWNFSSIKDTTIYHTPGDPAEWAPWPGHAETKLTPPPLLQAEEPTRSDPSEWNQWLDPLSPPPLLAAHPDAGAAPNPLNGRGMVAGIPRSATLLNQTLHLDLTALTLDSPVSKHIDSYVEGESFLQGMAPLGLLKFAAANVLAYVGVAIIEVSVTVIVRIPDTIIGSKMGADLPPWGFVVIVTPGGPVVDWRWGLFGQVQRGLNEGYAHEWDTFTGKAH
jgi:hypothetical protein